MTNVINLKGLFIDMLQDMYNAKRKVLEVLPKMEEAMGKDPRYASAFNKHFRETEHQVRRLEEMFEIISNQQTLETQEVAPRQLRKRVPA